MNSAHAEGAATHIALWLASASAASAIYTGLVKAGIVRVIGSTASGAVSYNLADKLGRYITSSINSAFEFLLCYTSCDVEFIQECSCRLLKCSISISMCLRPRGLNRCHRIIACSLGRQYSFIEGSRCRSFLTPDIPQLPLGPVGKPS